MGMGEILGTLLLDTGTCRDMSGDSRGWEGRTKNGVGEEACSEASLTPLTAKTCAGQAGPQGREHKLSHRGGSLGKRPSSWHWMWSLCGQRCPSPHTLPGELQACLEAGELPKWVLRHFPVPAA